MLNYQILKDKILGCYNGKNIGGAFGMPLEGKRGFFNYTYYLQEDIENNPVANDDLDLQIIWLNAVQRFGAGVDAEKLAEYWNTYLIPNWAEYGVGMSNLRRGLQAPLSGLINNHYGNSCGAFIRSEIWACLAPGNPEIATRYAYFDACVDHCEEGIYAEILTAAMQSIAFVERDIQKIITLAMGYIPEDCLIWKATDLMLNAYQTGKSFEEARDILFREIPGAFSYQNIALDDIAQDGYPLGKAGMDAPNNIGITILSLLYGAGDFEKSICYAVNCGEDADCTAGTVAATLGIIYGNSTIPQKWLAPIDGKIVTCCINLLDSRYCCPFFLPKNTVELTDAILAVIPKFMPTDAYVLDVDGLRVLAKENLTADSKKIYLPDVFGNFEDPYFSTKELLAVKEGFTKEFSLFKVQVEYLDGIYLSEGKTARLRVKLVDNGEGKVQRWVTMRNYSSEGLKISKTLSTQLLQNTYGYAWEQEFEITCNNVYGDSVDVIFDIKVEGQSSQHLVKATFFIQ